MDSGFHKGRRPHTRQLVCRDNLQPGSACPSPAQEPLTAGRSAFLPPRLPPTPAIQPRGTLVEEAPPPQPDTKVLV